MQLLMIIKLISYAPKAPLLKAFASAAETCCISLLRGVSGDPYDAKSHLKKRIAPYANSYTWLGWLMLFHKRTIESIHTFIF